MKKSDLGSLILLVAISFTAAYFLSNAIFNTPQSRSVEVEVITPISNTFPAASENIFNDLSLNPTTDIQIGQSATPNPFGGE